ncbi:gamma-glutamylcyclotransferase [Rhodopseudomonas sp. HC1]|uniref:gamma-glutamylcyclotransferase family protein n=1 Tax=Rhodopseudomonas infernalis TaxID=2897386 RepID=UPI001EE8596D|nr:gamma-glutamylcyclotransferase family protein [Rhodopseudomonas infernalis]MCG6207954.1 gamma-glutamylcyclotransferase [Rhodopseudomonas infernalis]
MLDRLFVYGTLMRGYDHPMARLLSDNADYLGAATMPGRLYQVRHYPGLIAATAASDLVFGDVFRLHRPAELLVQLDDYEGCGDGRDQPAQYRREVARVTLAACGEGEPGELEAFVYIYNLDVTQLRHIASGRFADVVAASG